MELRERFDPLQLLRSLRDAVPANATLTLPLPLPQSQQQLQPAPDEQHHDGHAATVDVPLRRVLQGVFTLQPSVWSAAAFCLDAALR